MQGRPNVNTSTQAKHVCFSVNTCVLLTRSALKLHVTFLAVFFVCLFNVFCFVYCKNGTNYPKEAKSAVKKFYKNCLSY